MLDSFPIAILIGAALGLLSGLGTGGGSLLLLWLTLVLHMSAEQARLINLMFFLPCALTATCLRCGSRSIPWKKLLLPIIAGCITAAMAAVFGQKMNTESLTKLFGALLIVIGCKELFYRPRKPR